MNDRLDIKSIFVIDATEHREALELIWPEITDLESALDLDVAANVLDRMQGRQLARTSKPVFHNNRPLVAHVFHEAGQVDAGQSVTFFAPVYQDDNKQIIEAAPIAMNKGQKLDFAMLVNFGCCSRAALSLVVMAHLNNGFYVIQKDADNVGKMKRGFFENLWQDQMHTPDGSHVAMHAIGQGHDCNHHNDGFAPKPS